MESLRRVLPLRNMRTILTPVLSRARRLPLLPAALLLPVITCGIFGSFFYPHDPTAMDLSIAVQPPAWLPGGDWGYILGTDLLGRDVLSRLIEGARISLLVAVVGVGCAGLIGVSLGMVAGYFEGKVDNLIMRIVDVFMSIPSVLLIILLAASLGGGLATIIIAIILVFWTHYARVIRGETLSIKQRDFVTLAKVTGCGSLRILLRHILPNVTPTYLVLASLQLGRAVILEASITFLGLGIQPPRTAWGLMVAESRAYLSTAWWIPTFAGLAIMFMVLGANLMGDWIRDALDPKLRQL